MDLSKIDRSFTLFLDRDGVINKRIYEGYVTIPGQFEFLPGVVKSFRLFNRLFGRIIVVTNQQGVGKGIMTEAELEKVNNLMISEIRKKGGRIDAVYYCTDLKEKPQNCRKPGTAMADRAKDDFPEIDFSKSIMVGDSESDMLFGEKKGMITVFVGKKEELSSGVTPRFIFGSLSEFALFLEKSLNQ